MLLANCCGCGRRGLFALLSIWCLLNLLRQVEFVTHVNSCTSEANIHEEERQGNSRPGHKVFCARMLNTT